MSMVHGQKKDEIMDDENASQTSQTGFNSDLVKKERIEEVRANLLINIQNFYTLKYIKISVFLISLFTILYGVIYLVLFYKIFDDLKTVNKLNIYLFQISNWLTSLIGTLVSLKTLYQKEKNNLNYTFNSFIKDNKEYFEQMRTKSFNLYENITKSYGELEHKIGHYLNQQTNLDLFWGIIHMTLYYNNVKNYGTFPGIFTQILGNVNSLLLNVYFNLNNSILNENAENYLHYISYISIENSFDNLIPSVYSKIQQLPKLLQNYNGASRNILFVFLLIYALLMFLFCILYSVLIYLSNENMGRGLEKISKIKIEKIEETIKKIESFHVVLKNFIQKDNSDNALKKEMTDKTINSQIQKLNENIIDNQAVNSSVNINGFSTETKKAIPLKILTTSYLQTILLFCILCAFLIPIYLITNSMVTSTNKLINVENYIFGKIIIAGASTLKIKCLMSECQNVNNLDFSGLIYKNNIQKIIQGISLFKELNIYYNEYYLLNACKSLFKVNTSEYDDCLNNEIIKSANNTESLLKLIEEIVDELYKDINLYTKINYTMSNGEKVQFKNYYLYESNSFNNLETIYYNYVAPVSDYFGDICVSSLSILLKNKRNGVVI